MVADYLSSLGLVFGMVGAWLLYKFLLPTVDRISAPSNNDIVAGEKKEQQYRTNARRGFLVLLVGFFLQLAAIWIPF